MACYKYLCNSQSVLHSAKATHGSSMWIARRMASTSARSATHGALTYDLVAKCSVRYYHRSLRAPCLNTLSDICTFTRIDYKSPRFRPHPAPWTCRTSHVHARRNSGFLEGHHSRAAGANRLPAMPKQYLPPRPQAWPGGSRCHWRRTQVARLEA